MTYQVIYTRPDGYEFVSEFQNETTKDNFCEVLRHAEIEYTIRVVDDRKWRLCRVVFDPAQYEAALNDPSVGYTFGDPDQLSKTEKLVKVQLENMNVKTVIVVDSWLATVAEINAVKTRLGRKHLCLVVGKPEKKAKPANIGVLKRRPANGVLTNEEMAEAQKRVDAMELVG